MRLRKRYLLAFVVLLVGALVPSPAAANGVPTMVASGFDAPRGVAFFNGHMMVAEAGRGGKNCSVNPPGPGAFCFGRTGKISLVNMTTGTHSTFVGNLFSLADYIGPNPDFLGLGGLSAHGGRLLAIEGVYPQLFSNYTCAPADSECEADLAAAKKEAGALLAVSHNGDFKIVANVGAFGYDYTANPPPGAEHDSNPYGVLASGSGAYVADAGSNTLDSVSGRGHIRILQHFTKLYPGFPHDEVPTCVARSGDSLWVGTLSGHLFQVEKGSATEVANADLRHVTGCTSDGEGTIYFVNMWTTPDFPTPGTGDIVKFNAEEDSSSVIASGLNFPNMDTIGPDRNLYFTADSVCLSEGVVPLCPTGGTVWKLALSSEDDD